MRTALTLLNLAVLSALMGCQAQQPPTYVAWANAEVIVLVDQVLSEPIPTATAHYIFVKPLILDLTEEGRGVQPVVKVVTTTRFDCERPRLAELSLDAVLPTGERVGRRSTAPRWTDIKLNDVPASVRRIACDRTANKPAKATVAELEKAIRAGKFDHHLAKASAS